MPQGEEVQARKLFSGGCHKQNCKLHNPPDCFVVVVTAFISLPMLLIQRRNVLA